MEGYQGLENTGAFYISFCHVTVTLFFFLTKLCTINLKKIKDQKDVQVYKGLKPGLES